MTADGVRIGDASKWPPMSDNGRSVDKTLSLDRGVTSSFLHRFRHADATKSATLSNRTEIVVPSEICFTADAVPVARTMNKSVIKDRQQKGTFLHGTNKLKETLKEARSTFLARSCGVEPEVFPGVSLTKVVEECSTPVDSSNRLAGGAQRPSDRESRTTYASLKEIQLKSTEHSYQNIHHTNRTSCPVKEQRSRNESNHTPVPLRRSVMKPSSLKKEDSKRNPARKVSFRVRSSTPNTRRTMTTLSPNRVAQLTTKFNQMVNETNTILDERRIMRAVKRANSVKGGRSDEANRLKTGYARNEELTKELKRTIGALEESVKLKPVVRKKPSVKREPGWKKDTGNKVCVRARIGYLEEPKSILKNTSSVIDKDGETEKQLEQNVEGADAVKETEKTGSLRKKPSVKRRPSFKTIVNRSTVGGVRAAIQIFEQKRPEHGAEKAPKPKVPEKNVAKTKQLVYKNGLPKLRDLSKNEIRLIAKQEENKTEPQVQKNTDITTPTPERVARAIHVRTETERRPNVIRTRQDATKETERRSAENTELSRDTADGSGVEIQAADAESEETLHKYLVKEPVEIVESESGTTAEDTLQSSETPEECSSTVAESVCEQKRLPKIKPNNSFLWRSKSKELLRLTFTTYEFADSIDAGSKAASVGDNLYDYVGTGDTKPPSEDSKTEPANNGGFEMAPVMKTPDEREYRTMMAKTDAIIQKFKEDITTILRKNSCKQEDEDDYEPLTPSCVEQELPDLVRCGVGGSVKRYSNLPNLPLPPTENENLDCETKQEDQSSVHSYEYCISSKYEDLDQHSDGYEYCKGQEESLYEQLPARSDPIDPQKKSIPPRRMLNGSAEPLPPKPDSVRPDPDYLENESNIYYTVKNDPENMSESNCYESIYSVSPEAPRKAHPPNQQRGDEPKPNDAVENVHCTGNSVFYDDFGSSGSSATAASEKDSPNCYESIYVDGGQRRGAHHDDQNSNSGSNRDSIISYDQQSNSLYGGRSLLGWNPDSGATYCFKAGSELSSSDRSDDWVDISEPESPVEGERALPGWVIVRERSSKCRRTAGWSHKVRDQWEKSPRKWPTNAGDGDSDSDHHYESLYTNELSPVDDDYDSFDSDTDSDCVNQNDSGVDMNTQRLPDPPSSGTNYALTKLAATAGKHMQRLRRNWSLTKNDITKSLSRMTKKKSAGELSTAGTLRNPMKPVRPPPIPPRLPKPLLTVSPPLVDQTVVLKRTDTPPKTIETEYQNMNFELGDVESKRIPPKPKKDASPSSVESTLCENTSVRSSQSSSSPTTENGAGSGDKDKKDRRKYWSLTHKFRRSLSMSSEPTTDAAAENETVLPMKPKSTFYLTDTVDVDTGRIETKPTTVEVADSQPAGPKIKTIILGQLRPTSPPPAPPLANTSPTSQKSNKKEKQRATSWYAECGVFRGDRAPIPIPKTTPAERPNTCWYAAVGLYQNGGTGSSSSTGVSSSAENSGNSFSSSSTVPCTTDPDRTENRSLHSASTNSDEGFKSSTLTNCEVNPNDHYYNLKNDRGPISEPMNGSLERRTSSVGNYPDDMQKRLLDEPLYQFYTAAVIESGMRELRSDSSWEDDESDGYERVGDLIDRTTDNCSPLRPTAMQLITPLMAGQVRTLWCEVPEVIDSAVLSTLNPHQKKLQEAKFEMITSEASYLNSLNVLCNHFIAQLDDDQLANAEDRRILFGNISAVKQCSELLLEDLESCWQNNILLRDICDVIQRHAETNFAVYVTYCESQIYADRTLKKLKERRGAFFDTLTELESSSACQSLPLHSFLMLPMQRVTRLPLLADAILKRLNPDDDEYVPCQTALATLNKIVKQCNEGARRSQRREEFDRTWRLFDFPRDIPAPALDADSERWLERSGELTQLISRGDETKLTFGRKFIKSPLHLFLFTDLLIVAKRKSDECYVVLHYCPRSFIEVNSGETLSQLPVKEAAGKYLLFVTLLENHEKRTIEMLLSCVCESDRQRWYEVLSTPVSTDPDETLYERWDCPQVAALHTYLPQQPDELPLEAGDIVNVTRKMADGWYQGERLRDGRVGWFPGNHVTEVASAHVRARNLKQRYRLLALSGSYLESQKKVK